MRFWSGPCVRAGTCGQGVGFFSQSTASVKCLRPQGVDAMTRLHHDDRDDGRVRMRAGDEGDAACPHGRGTEEP